MSRRDRQRTERALTGNAADPQQVAYAAKKEKDREQLLLAALQQVLETPAGRRVFGELLERAGLYRTIWDPSAKIHFNEGRRNFGLEILALVQQAGDDLYLQMESEMRAMKRALDRETDAVQQSAASRHDGGSDGE